MQDVEDWLKLTINDADKLTGERSIWSKEVHRAAYLHYLCRCSFVELNHTIAVVQSQMNHMITVRYFRI